MNLRRLSGWGGIILIIVLAVLSYFGNRTIFYIYLGLSIPFLIFHSAVVCARCNNIYCPFNKKSPDFVFRLKQGAQNKYSNKPIYSDKSVLLVQIILVLILIIPFIAVWQFSPLAFFALLILTALIMVAYTKKSCRYCTNNCSLNKNPDYRQWKKNKG